MQYTVEFFVEFLKQLEIYSADCEKIFSDAKDELTSITTKSAKSVSAKKEAMSTEINSFTEQRKLALKTYDQTIKTYEKDEESLRSDLISKIMLCKERIATIRTKINKLSAITHYSNTIKNQTIEGNLALSADSLMNNIDEFSNLIQELESTSAMKKNYVSKCIEVATYSESAIKVLSARIKEYEKSLFKNQNTIDAKRNAVWSDFEKKSDVIEKEKRSKQSENLVSVDDVAKEMQLYKKSEEQKVLSELDKKLMQRKAEFHKIFPPEELEKLFFKIYEDEPQIDNFLCKTENPTSVRISDLVYNISDLNLGRYAMDMLNKDYFFLTKYKSDRNRSEMIKSPYCVTFDNNFNYLFEVNNINRKVMIDRACSIAMRLFMMLPPNKVNFTFFDPITLGETFASFTRLVEVDDRTSKVINGKIWTSAEDIEDKLRIATDHIANVTQRCLQGQYENIQQYNVAAGQNAEPYQVIMVMDFPAGFNENSLRLLEQIISTGPKCGVYTILLKSAEQYAKADEKKLVPLINNIMNNVSKFVASGNVVAFDNVSYRDKKITFDIPESLSNEELNKVIPILKSGIKNAEKIVIDFDKIIPPKADWFKGDCSSELSIPIGVHGANNIQNLTFGIGGSHHALVAGQTGSGKSSLLHTIIMSSLIKYPADQLQIFLVDFKRGVEFKIYANYSLENFKVVAIESEREFGCSVLEYLDKEQSRRADKFKRLNVDNVEDYRKKSGETLPRVLLIIDEFHVLFSKDSNDLMSKNSSAYLEQIIRQGRAFGIHVILASQTMSNIGGISNGVWGQVGVRIALKCPKSDAKFVLGSDNDGVDLLSSDNPGQALYNSDCGNVIANTIFRVAYIDQDDQDEYLKYISENGPKFDYPETRVMLSNVEDNIYNPFQKFANGQNVDFSENSVLVGEPLKLINNMRMTFKQKQSSNMLVIGNDEQKARTLFTFAALSLALHKLSSNNYKKPTKPYIYLFDYAPIEDYYDKDIMLELAKMLPHYIKYIPFDDANDVMEDLYLDFTKREKNEAEISDTYMMIYGLQRARDLRSNNVYQNKSTADAFDDFDEFGGSVQQQLSVKPYEMFLNLLQRGATVGINSIIWEDNFKIFMAHYANMLSNFDLRIGFTMPDDDSIGFMEEANASKLSENSAIYSYNGNQKFRPYKKPDLDWLKRICERIESFE